MSNVTHRLVSVTAKKLIHGKHFNLGYKHVQQGMPFDSEYDMWNMNDQWNYERGRQYGALVGNLVPPKTGKKVNLLAIKLLAMAHNNKIIL